MTDQELLNSNIIAELGLEKLPDDQKIRLVQNATDLIQKRALLVVLQKLSEDERGELEQLIEKEGSESASVAGYLQQHISDMDQILQKEVLNVKKELIEKAKEITTAPSS